MNHKIPGFWKSSLFFAAIFSLLPLVSHAGEFSWPNGAKAAVNLAYDDALASQLENVIPALNERGFRGSFYIPAGAPLVMERLEEWRAAAKQGHELGNHSLFHQCDKQLAGREWVEPHRDLSQIPPAAWAEQIALANDFLKLIDGKDERTFTPPCGDLKVGDTDYLGRVKSLFVASKAFGAGAVTASMQDLDPYAVTVTAPAGVTGEALIALVEEAARKGTMANFTFHGVGGDHLSVSVAAHNALLDHLAAHPERYWVDSFVNIMTYVTDQQ
ncbi:polysaccharide deacetylase family protein [Marinimicrobium agarilyticum]|uniref:polysaccharide deacetylase family protein n=1 Tax=Marinimicrobium agarilyticum TaxID=306546 RepID=UPI000412B192|nr:polysaccharide deacetylase family protein [Marinimicrobium agarilyticum]